MLRRDFMPRAHNAALEQRESRFHGVCVHVTVSILAGMIDSLVKVLLHFVESVRINLGFIRHNDFDVATNVCVDDVADSFGLRIASADQTQISVALPDADDYRLLALRTPPAGFAANIGFIYLNG